MASVILAALCAWLAPAALAASPIEEAQLAEVDRVRGEIASQIHLSAYDLVDELVYGWINEPIFAAPTPVVLAGVSVPVGLGTGLQALLENHIAAVLLANPVTNVELVHCPTCTAVVVHSGPEGTVVSRGVDSPAVLEELGESTGKHALFIDVEAEGAWLVLRARITALTPDLPIVWSRTLASSTSSPAMLRQPDDLKSVSDARQEYLAALHDRGPIAIPLRLMVRTYARPSGEDALGPPPFIWMQTGLELSSTDARAWTSSVIFGYSFIPQAYQGIMAQSRVSRLLTGRVRSHTRPDLYGYVGAAVISAWGPATAALREETLTADELLTDSEGDDPRTAFGALHIGAEIRIGNRIGVSSFLETMPALRNSLNMGEYVNVATIGFSSLGTEVTFWF